jgi:hypothetical protein
MKKKYPFFQVSIILLFIINLYGSCLVNLETDKKNASFGGKTTKRKSSPDIFDSKLPDLEATNYYISNSGNDVKDGKSPENAWQTINKAETKTFSPGDSIFLERGSIFRETFTIPSSGSADDYIYIGAYGEGDNPAIYGSMSVMDWVATGTANIWQSNTEVPIDPYTVIYYAEIFFELHNDSVAWGDHETYNADFTNLDAEYDWTWDNSTIYVYATSDPDEAYANIEAPQRGYSIKLNDQEYLTFQNLDLHYMSYAGIADNYGTVELHGLNVLNCHISYIGRLNSTGAYGLDIHHSDTYIAHNEFNDCGRRAISLTMYATTPITVSNMVVEHNEFYRGWHTTGVDCNNAGNHIIDSVIIRYNHFTDNNMPYDQSRPSNHIFISNQTGSTGSGIVRNIYIYNNILEYARGKAIILEDVDTAYVMFNTIYGFNKNVSNWQPLISVQGRTNGSEQHIFNNIIYHNGDEDMNASLLGFYNNWAEAMGPATFDYNLWYAEDPRASLFVFYDPYDPDGYERNYNTYSYRSYKTKYPQYDEHSPFPSDPLFFAAEVGEYSLTEGSPAKGAALPVPLIVDDYYGNPRDPSEPSIGAIEYQFKLE